MRCTLNTDKFGPRAQIITKLLRPIVPKGRSLSCRPRLLNRQMVLSAYLGSEPIDTSPDLWRFSTRISRIRASYYERWISVDYRQQAFFLDRAYLHLYLRSDAITEREIVALHCDPNEAQSGRHFRYKAGPHIHMSTAQDPLHHSHIALNNESFPKVLSSVANLTVAIEMAVALVDDQVLGLYV